MGHGEGRQGDQSSVCRRLFLRTQLLAVVSVFAGGLRFIAGTFWKAEVSAYEVGERVCHLDVLSSA